MSAAIENASTAERIIADPVYCEITRQIDEAIMRQLQACDVRDDETKLKLVTMLQLHQQYQKLLIATVERGQLAEDYLRKKSILNKRGL
jgi:hypothetical protein